MKAVVLFVSGAELSLDIPGSSEWEVMALTMELAQQLTDQVVDSASIFSEPVAMMPATPRLRVV